MEKSTGVRTTAAKPSTALAGTTEGVLGATVAGQGILGGPGHLTSASAKWVYTSDKTTDLEEAWGYVARPKKTAPIPWPQPYNPAPTPVAHAPDVHAKITELLQEELEKSRVRIMEQAKQDSLTPEQIGEAMHRAFIAGIQWAMDNMPEIAQKLGYTLPAEDTMAQLLAAMQMTPPVTSVKTTLMNPGNWTNTSGTSFKYSAINATS